MSMMYELTFNFFQNSGSDGICAGTLRSSHGVEWDWRLPGLQKWILGILSLWDRDLQRIDVTGWPEENQIKM